MQRFHADKIFIQSMASSDCSNPSDRALTESSAGGIVDMWTSPRCKYCETVAWKLVEDTAKNIYRLCASTRSSRASSSPSRTGVACRCVRCRTDADLRHLLRFCSKPSLSLRNGCGLGRDSAPTLGKVPANIAAIGGAAINLLYHSKMLPPPIPLIIVHASLAAAGFVLLLVSVIGFAWAG